MKGKRILVLKLNYCKGIIIVHGKSELLLAEHIKSNLHLPIEIYALKNGKMSIQIDSLMNVLGNNIFKSKTALKKNFIVEEEQKCEVEGRGGGGLMRARE